MAYGFRSRDENGRDLAQVPYEVLLALAPLTDDPDAVLARLGIQDDRVKAALVELAEIARSEQGIFKT